MRIKTRNHAFVLTWNSAWSVWFVFSLVVLALVETAMGRQLWSLDGTRCLLQPDPLFIPNSQCILDHWTPGHVEHGLLFYLLLHGLSPHRSWAVKIGACVVLEFIWEVIENSNYIIRRYNWTGYLGDSLVNSCMDCIACLYGFLLAIGLGTKRTLFLMVLLEILSYK